jgi:hypothetical protein
MKKEIDKKTKWIQDMLQQPTLPADNPMEGNRTSSSPSSSKATGQGSSSNQNFP